MEFFVWNFYSVFLKGHIFLILCDWCYLWDFLNSILVDPRAAQFISLLFKKKNHPFCYYFLKCMPLSLLLGNRKAQRTRERRTRLRPNGQTFYTRSQQTNWFRCGFRAWILLGWPHALWTRSNASKTWPEYVWIFSTKETITFEKSSSGKWWIFQA